MQRYTSLLLSFILGSVSLPTVAQVEFEAFDNNFIMKDTVYIIKKECTTQNRQVFRSFATQQLLEHFNKTSKDLLTGDHEEVVSFIKPFDISYDTLLKYTSIGHDQYARYRLIVMANYSPFGDGECILGFGIFPEAWDGETWTRFASNKRLELEILTDYVHGKTS